MALQTVKKEKVMIRCPIETYEDLLHLDELSIKMEIKRIKSRVRYLKAEVVKEAKGKLKVEPSTWLRLCLAREELGWAIKACVDSGYEYEKTKGEARKEKMIEKLEKIKSFSLYRDACPSFNSGAWILEFGEDKVDGSHTDIKRVDGKYEIIKKHFLVEREEVMENVFDLHVEEWKKKYEEPLVLDGERWRIELEFSDGEKWCYEGYGDYPFSFFHLVEKLSQWERNNTYSDLSGTFEKNK